MGDEHDSSDSLWVRLPHLVNKSAAKELTVCCSQQSATRKVVRRGGCCSWRKIIPHIFPWAITEQITCRFL